MKKSMFSTLNSRYYDCMQAVLEAASSEAIASKEIYKIINGIGFEETASILGPKLLNPHDSDGYRLLNKEGAGYVSILKNPPKKQVTTMELSWLKNMIQDQKINLFLEDETLEVLENALEDVEPLYPESIFESIHVKEQGDDYISSDYSYVFKLLSIGIREKKAVKIHYEASKGRRIVSTFMPTGFLYSMKNDKIQVQLLRLSKDYIRPYTFDLSRIKAIEIVDKKLSPILDLDYEQKERVVEIELTNMRNAFERCFIQLSHYKRQSEYDEKTGKCRIKISYEGNYESELLILLMSFGPALEVLGPESFRKQMVERLRQQFVL